jgi:hypothetical protein
MTGLTRPYLFYDAAVVASEMEPDIVQISGGEPTIHPDFFAILDAAKRRPIRHLMVNTNGVRIARDAGFAERLASYMPGFEIYLQFDSLEARPLEILRGADLRDVRMRALERLNELNLSTTLVVTLQRGVNDQEIGRIIDFALQQRCVRGITFQPVQAAGRLDGYDDALNRLTLSQVRKMVVEQSDVFREEDLIPVPCHPHALCMAYAIKLPVKKSCIHIAHPDGRLIPFDTYNLFYRDDLEQTRLAPIREAVERAMA